MQQLVFVKRGVLEWQEVPSPKISGPNQAIVRPLAVARCDLDLPILHGHTLFRPPFPIGHEFVGEISELSEDLSQTFSVGQKVAVAFQVACGTCPVCQKGRSKSCANQTGAHDYGMGGGGKSFGGALSDLLHVPFAKHMLLPLAEDTDLIAVASLSDNIVEAWKLAGSILEKQPGTPTMILGGFAASIGLYTASLSVAMGSDTLYLDTDPVRLDLAQKLGARTEQVGELPRAHPNKCGLVVDASGTEEGYRFCVRSADVEGTITSASIFWTNKFSIPYMDLYLNGATLKIARVDSRESMPRVLEWIASGKLRARDIVSATADFSQAADAWLEPSTKLVITRG